MNNILIVDDKSENLYLLELMLKGGGFTTVAARNGAEALVSARQALPDLIISDILMPIMDGFTLCRELKKDRKLKNIPFIFYTATYTDPKDEEFALSLGADRFLLKPMDITEFISTINEVLKETKKKNIRKIETPSSHEEVILKEYNEVLVRKLEDKMLQIEHAEKEVRKYNIALLRQIEERKQAEEALRNNDARLHTLVQTIPDLIWLKDKDGVYLSCNTMFERFCGAREADIVGKTDYDFVERELADFFREHDRKAMAAGKSFINEEWITFADDGHRALLETIKAPMYDTSGTLIGVLGIGRDITERKRFEESLKKQKDEFETIFNLVPAQIWYKDTHNNFIRVNRQVCTDIGMTNDKIEGHSAEELFPSFAQQYFKDDLEVFNTRKPKLGITEKVNSADGEIRWVLSDKVPVFGNDGEVNGLVAVVQDITERKRTEEKIREAQILLQASIESPKDVIILSIDKNYKYLYYNSVHENFVRTAYGKDVKLGMNLLECITNDDDRRKAKINYDKALNGLSHATVTEYGDLERHHYETRYNPIYNDKKEIIGATAFSANITERKRAEETLRESEAKLDEALKIAKLGTWEYDVDREQFTFNDQFYSLLHTTAEREGGYTMSPMHYANKFLHPDDSAKVGVETQKALETTDPNYYSHLDHRIICADGEIGYISVNIKVVKDIHGRTVKTYGVNQVITDRKRAEEALTYERNLLKALMDNTTDHIYIKDSENRFIRISKAHANIFGISDPADAIGKTDFDFFTEEHARLAYDAELEIMKTGKPVVDLEEKETWPDGRVTWVSTTKVPLRDINGKVFGTFGVSRDITERNHILEELMIAKEKAEQSDKLKTAFLAQMSHEIRTPLNAIVGNTNFLNDLFGDKMDAEAHDCFDSINLASERMIRTVDLILNAAELQTSGYKPHFVKVDLNNAILSKLYLEYQLSARQKGLKFDYTCKEKETVVTVDEYSVTQIFSNLIDNAIKYTTEGKVEIHLGKNIKGNIFVEVRDTGIGMNESFLPAMFDPFVQEDQGYSRSYEGNGLGLTLVKKYCEFNHATIEVESRKNIGSAFKIIFTNSFTEAHT